METNMWQKMSKGQQITAGGGAVALVASFLPWYVLKEQFIDSISVKGTEFTFGWMGMVLLVGAAALTVAPAFGKNIGNDKIGGEQIAIVAAALGSLLWLIRLVQVPALFFGAMGRGFGLFIAAAAAATVTTGVVMTMKEKGIDMPNAETFKALTNSDAAPAAPVQAAAPVTPQQQFAAPQPAAPVAPQQHYPAPQPAAPVAPQQHYPAPQPAAPAPQQSGHVEF